MTIPTPQEAHDAWGKVFNTGTVTPEQWLAMTRPPYERIEWDDDTVTFHGHNLPWDQWTIPPAETPVAVYVVATQARGRQCVSDADLIVFAFADGGSVTLVAEPLLEEWDGTQEGSGYLYGFMDGIRENVSPYRMVR